MLSYSTRQTRIRSIGIANFFLFLLIVGTYLEFRMVSQRRHNVLKYQTGFTENKYIVQLIAYKTTNIILDI